MTKRTEALEVVGQDGLRGQLVDQATSSSDPKQRLVQFEDGTRLLVPSELLKWRSDTQSYYLTVSSADLEQLKQDQFALGASDTTQAPLEFTAGTPLVLPVIQEEIELSKREVITGGVRVRKQVHEHKEVVQMPLEQTKVNIERVALNQTLPADAPVPQSRYEGDTLIISVVEEIVIVEKRLRVTEEIHITKQQVTIQSQPQSVTLRQEEVVIERFKGDTSSEDQS